jgi:hypothetical protein
LSAERATAHGAFAHTTCQRTANPPRPTDVQGRPTRACRRGVHEGLSRWIGIPGSDVVPGPDTILGPYLPGRPTRAVGRRVHAVVPRRHAHS